MESLYEQLVPQAASLKPLPDKEAAVLSQLTSTASRELYGLEMVRHSGGLLRMGTVYVTLARMEQKGLVTSRAEEGAVGRKPRRLYCATRNGVRALRAWQASRRALLDVWAHPCQ